MFVSLLNVLGNWSFLLLNPIGLVMAAFQLWMLVHALRNREWLYAGGNVILSVVLCMVAVWLG